MSPSPHRHLSPFRGHSRSPYRHSPSPTPSPFKQRRGKHSQMDTMEDYNQSPLRNRQARHNDMLTSGHDENLPTDHIMTESPPRVTTPSKRPSRHRRPLSISFTNNDPSFSKRLATSFMHPSVRNTSPSEKKSALDDAPATRGLRRSTGLLNLDQASLGSPVTRKPSYRSRKSHINHSSSSSACSTYSNSSGSSISSIHSDVSRSSTPPPPFNATASTPPPVSRISTPGSFSFNLDTQGMPPKRPHAFGFNSESTPKIQPTKPKWTFNSDSSKQKWQFNDIQNTPSSSSSLFFRKPYFNTADSTSSPFLPPNKQPSTLSIPATPKIQKVRKMTSSDCLNIASPNFMNNKTESPHPLGRQAISPTPSPAKSRPATPNYINTLSAPSSCSSSSTIDASSSEAKFMSKQPFKLNASLEADISTRSAPAGFSTPENFTFVKPLQTAFLSTGLLSKRNRRKPGFEERVAPPDTPCKKPLVPMTPGPSHLSTNTKSLFGNTFLSSPRSLPRNLHGSTSNNSTSRFGRNRFSIEFGSFDDQFNNEPSTPTKRNSFNSQAFNMPMRPFSNSKLEESANFVSRTSTPINGSDSSISHFSSTPQSQTSRWLDGSPSEHSSPSTPMGVHSEMPKLTLPLQDENNVIECAEENHEMEDVETPRTPAKGKSQGEIAIPSSAIAMGNQNDAIDVGLSERFADVELIGKGEFSVVYAASEKSSIEGIEPLRYAIKRTKSPLIGSKARARSTEEVEILRNLTDTDNEGREYIINLIEAWEYRGHMYIMTEYCENGNLDSFLSERGNVSRLDEWRVWKILVEITLVSLRISSIELLLTKL